jgi:hypothetical protein
VRRRSRGNELKKQKTVPGMVSRGPFFCLSDVVIRPVAGSKTALIKFVRCHVCKETACFAGRGTIASRQSGVGTGSSFFTFLFERGAYVGEAF